MLTLVGLGLRGKGLTLRGLEKLENADVIYAELYTSPVPDLDLNLLAEKVGREIKVLNRKTVEENPDEVLEASGDQDVVFLVPGDPMVATTHVDLRLRAERRGIDTEIVHGPSIETAAPGLAGLQSYKFGRSATLPLPEKPSETPYEVLEVNEELGLHTLFLLDIEAEEGRYLTADRAIRYLLDLEGKLGRGAFTEGTLSVVVARAGTSRPLVRAERAINLLNEDFGPPPQVLIVPGKLHFMEAEALRNFAGAPEEALRENVER